MHIEVIGFKMTNNSDVGGFLEVPELKTGHFVNYYGIWLKVVEDVKSGDADVTNEISVLIVGV